nr:MAG TPA: tail assembly chaperone protein [Bacteriophage sp.]
MKLSVGKIAFPIEFDNGDKDVIYFNPNDPDLASRLMNAKNKIDTKIKDLNTDDFNLLNDGSIEIPENINDVNEFSDEQRETIEKRAEQMTRLMDNTKNIIYEELDKAFDSDISSVVFKHCSPFAIIGGEHFITQFLNAIAPEIQKHIKKSNADMEKKMSKHIGKYRK